MLVSVTRRVSDKSARTTQLASKRLIVESSILLLKDSDVIKNPYHEESEL
jgi:hypothetical protein